LLSVSVGGSVAAGGFERPAGPGQSDQRGPQARGNWPKAWYQDDAVKKELALTPKQVRDIDQLYESNRAKLNQLFDDVRKQETELDRLIKEGKVEESIISLQLDRVEVPRTELNKTRILMLYRMYRVLTPDQNQKLQALQDKMHGRRGGGAFH
jgi:Spy/CpxP family protein refolding chaperone